VLDVVGVAEIAQLVGVSRQRVHELMRSDVTFPDPAAELSAGRIWHRHDIEQWMATRLRPERECTVEDVGGVALVSPRSFADMQVVGDKIRESSAVAVELRKLDVVQMRRCIDFLAGAGYVVDGTVEKLADRSYLVTPAGSTVTKVQRARLEERLEQ
jgi:FtsZ-interacting cell division protein YlmF